MIHCGYTAYTSDPNGNLANKTVYNEHGDPIQSWKFGWDADDQLVSVTTPEGRLGNTSTTLSAGESLNAVRGVCALYLGRRCDPAGG